MDKDMITQKFFDELYDVGIEKGTISLTKSMTLTPMDLLDAYMEIMVNKGMTTEEIMRMTMLCEIDHRVSAEFVD